MLVAAESCSVDRGSASSAQCSAAAQYSVFSNFSATVTVSPSGPPGLFKGVTTPMSGVLARFPWLLPVRNPVVGFRVHALEQHKCPVLEHSQGEPDAAAAAGGSGSGSRAETGAAVLMHIDPAPLRSTSPVATLQGGSQEEVPETASPEAGSIPDIRDGSRGWTYRL